MAAFMQQLQPFEENQSPSPVEEIGNPYEISLSRSTSPGRKQLRPISTSPVNTLQSQLDPESPLWRRTASSRSPTNPRRLQPMEMLDSPRSFIPPHAPFRRRTGTSSNRSSIHDLTSLNSEELWNLEQAEFAEDRSKRLSANKHGLPGDVIWPSAPAESYTPPIKSKSVTSLASLKGRRQSRKVESVDLTQPYGQMISSAHSSTTSLGLTPNKSLQSLNKPPSAYYNRDFLSSLGPREGGYAVAAQIGSPVEDKRRSFHEKPQSRAPMSKSAGMGRWSLDGGEHYGRPYATPSAATTSSNLSAAPINSPNASPTDSCPEGAARTPISSPLNGPPVQALPIPAPAEPIPAGTQPVAVPRKSKKELAKEVKAAEKLEAQKLARARADAARQERLQKQQEKEAATKAKEDAKRKAKEDKARLKAEKSKSPTLPFKTAVLTAPAVNPPPQLQSIPAMPLAPEAPTTPTPQLRTRKSTLGFLGTIKKRLSFGPSLAPPTPPRTTNPAAAQSSLDIPYRSANPSTPPSEPTSFHSEPLASAERSSPSYSQRTTPALNRPLSRDSPSVRGPRAMPHSPNRPSSISTTPSADYHAPSISSSGFHFSGQSEVITPESSTSSQVVEIASPFTSAYGGEMRDGKTSNATIHGDAVRIR